jgi:mevalonate kinase
MAPTPTRASKRLKGNPHRGFGKLILFGEHFVVYKVPALVGAVAAYTDCTVSISDAEWSHGLIVEDNRPAIPGYKDEKAEEMLAGTQLVLKHMGFDTAKKGIKITLGGDLCAVSGIGASAANCVSVARALAAAQGKSLSEEEINAAGYEGEKGYHGEPSGIDNTAATYGGVLKFQRTDAAPIFETRKLSSPALIVYASTGITASTSKVVADVKAKKDKDPKWFDDLLMQYNEVYEGAEEALKTCDWKKVGQLADKNHELLQNLTVSCKELDDLVLAARAAGALGAKMAGTGRGGLMWAICEDAKSQAAVAEALGKIAPQVWKTEFA